MKNWGYGILTETQNKKEYKTYSERNSGRGYCMQGKIYPNKNGYVVRFVRSI
jgi:hypothetical protein